MSRQYTVDGRQGNRMSRQYMVDGRQEKSKRFEDLEVWKKAHELTLKI